MALNTQLLDMPSYMSRSSDWTQRQPNQAAEFFKLGLINKQRQQQNALEVQAMALREKQTDVLNQMRFHQMQEAAAEMEDAALLREWNPDGPIPKFKSQKSYERLDAIQNHFARTTAGRAALQAEKLFFERVKDLAPEDQIAVTDALAQTRGRITKPLADFISQAWKNRPSQDTAAITNARETSRLRKEADALRETDPAGADDLLRQAAQIEATSLGPNEVIESSMDEKGNPIVRISRGGGTATNAPTVSTKSKLEQDLLNTQSTMNLLGDLGKNLRWQDVGVAGVIGENVMDRVLPQFGIKSFDQTRTDNRTKLKMLAQGALRQISPDNRFTNEDRARVEAIVPNSGLFESEEHAKQAIKTIQRVFALRMVRDRQKLGQPITFDALSNEEIAASVEMGLFDREEAKAWLMENR